MLAQADYRRAVADRAERRLLIVDQLTHNWGRTGDDRAGWTIWFEMECW